MRYQFGLVLGLAGGSRFLNRVLRALLVMTDWSTVKHKPSGSISSHLGRKSVRTHVRNMFAVLDYASLVSTGERGKPLWPLGVALSVEG